SQTGENNMEITFKDVQIVEKALAIITELMQEKYGDTLNSIVLFDDLSGHIKDEDNNRLENFQYADELLEVLNNG
ncbi:hypothetical protein ABK046_49635, partial [Streptomyces caeruleatus]